MCALGRNDAVFVDAAERLGQAPSHVCAVGCEFGDQLLARDLFLLFGGVLGPQRDDYAANLATTATDLDVFADVVDMVLGGPIVSF